MVFTEDMVRNVSYWQCGKVWRIWSVVKVS